MLRNKRGDVTEYILVPVILFFIAISFLVVALVNDQLKGVITDTALNETDIAGTITNQMDTITQTTIPNAFIVFFGFIALGMMVSAFLIRIHPVFMFLYIIFLAVSVFLTIFLANGYYEVASNDVFADIIDYQSPITWIWSHIVIIELALGALSMIITFGKLFGGTPESPI